MRTPFGDADAACVLRVPHATTVRELPHAAGVALTYANGSVATLPPCASPHAVTYERYAARRRAAVMAAAAPRADPPPIWDGWPRHLWFGLSYASFTTPPLVGRVLNFSTTWRVPAAPQRQVGNKTDPWGGYAPTLSTCVKRRRGGLGGGGPGPLVVLSLTAFPPPFHALTHPPHHHSPTSTHHHPAAGSACRAARCCSRCWSGTG